MWPCRVTRPSVADPQAGAPAAAAVALSEAELTALIGRVLISHGMTLATAPHVARVVAAAERDGAFSHGLLRMPGYVASLDARWVDGAATPRIQQTSPAMLAVDACNGFAQVALSAARAQACGMARAMGLAAISIRDSHHFAALWPDVEPFAAEGLIALSMVNSRSHMAVWGGRRKVLGTNPVAFACPRADGPPVVWDQASSVRAQGEVILARNRSEAVPDGTGVDVHGEATTDPAVILDGGALLPFSGAKGGNIAFMVEILAAALGGGPFGFDVDSSGYPGAQTSRTGQFILLLDPARSGASHFGSRIEALLQALAEAGSSRLPGDRRYAHRARAQAEGIPIPARAHAALLRLIKDPDGS